MSPDGREIIDLLGQVRVERLARERDPCVGDRVAALKRYQSRRLERTYSDLLAAPRYRDAALFFLEELYGPRDFTARDAQFERIVPALCRIFSRDVTATVRDLCELHALSERLDGEMAALIVSDVIDAARYVAAWSRVATCAQRFRQVELMRRVGDALDRYTRSPLLARTLHLMRRPARAAGLGALQEFLERGFDTFRAMGGAATFLDIVVERETALIRVLFDPELALEVAAHGIAGAVGRFPALAQLP